MQPTIVCTAPVAGMIYLNGRFAGEASRERPLFAPVSPSGAVYIEYRPLSGEGNLARKCVFSGGRPLAESLSGAGGLSCVAWPGGVLEVECGCPSRLTERFYLDGLPCLLERGEETVLRLNGMDIALPENAGRPSLTRTAGAALLLGDTGSGGRYLIALTPDLAAQTGYLAAESIDFSSTDMLSAIVSLGDSVGHGRLEQWLIDEGGLHRVSSESVWSAGTPRWPDTAEGAMIAAVEAALSGLTAEAEGYLSPALAAAAPLSAVGEICDLCVPMKYAPPDARPCVGLLRAENDHLAAVRPLYYRAEKTGGIQGPWRITWIGSDT